MWPDVRVQPFEYGDISKPFQKDRAMWPKYNSYPLSVTGFIEKNPAFSKAWIGPCETPPVKLHWIRAGINLDESNQYAYLRQNEAGSKAVFSDDGLMEGMEDHFPIYYPSLLVKEAETEYSQGM